MIEVIRKVVRQEDPSAALLEGVLSASPHGISIFSARRDNKGQIKDLIFSLLNDKAAEFYGAKKSAALMGQGLFQAFPHLKGDLLFSGLYHQVLETGRTASTIKQIKSLHGDKWYRVNIARVGDGVIVNTVDITSEKQKTALIEKQRRLHRRIFNTVPVGILDLKLCNQGGIEIIRINEAAVTIFEMNEPEMAALQFNDLFDQTALRDITLQIAAAVDKRETVDCDVILRGDDGSKKYFSLIFTPLFDESEKLEVVQCLVWDITQRKNAEELIHQSQKMQSVGQLAGGIAHDFNNRLTVITGNLELLERKLSNDPFLRELIEEALASASSSATLTKQLLAYSRKQNLYPQVVDCNDQIRSLKSMVQRTLGQEIRVEGKMEENIWPVYVDPSQFDTAIINFILNARDAMPAGGKLILRTENIWLTEAYCEKYPDMMAGPYVKVSVSDTGSGISSEILPQVLDPFFTTKDVGKGSGLGLSTAYGFAKQSRGHLDIISRVGKGTSVCLYLPSYSEELKTGKVPVKQVITGQEPFSHKQIPQGNGEVILVAEDDRQLRKVVRNMLSELNYRVYEAKNGQEALKLFEKKNDEISLVFADIMMPGGMSGLELAQTVRQQNDQIPILLATGHARSNKGEALFSQNFPILTKPYKFKDLAEALHGAIKHAS